MRTFHTGGVAGLDITSGLPRVEELFEARVPKGYAVLADIDGVVVIEDDPEGRRLRVISREEYREDYPVPADYEPLVKNGAHVEAGDFLARFLTKPKRAKKDIKASKPTEVVANVSGQVEIGARNISIIWEDVEERVHVVPASAHVLVENGAALKAGDALTAGPLNPHDILRIRSKEDLQRYLVGEVQKVYRSQGVGIHDKHIEVILRQMLRRVQVDTPGDAEFIPGQIVDRFEFQDKNAKVLAEGGEPATAKAMLIGVTKASLLTDSFLAAASFQETTRVLTEAAVAGARDRLLGLKENVIIGRLIPARANFVAPETIQLAAGQETDGFSGSWLDIPEAPSTNGHGNGHEAGEEIFKEITEE